MSKINVNGQGMSPVLLRVFVTELSSESKPKEHRFVGLRGRDLLYVTPFSDTSKFFAVNILDTLGDGRQKPLGTNCRTLFASSDDWDRDDRFHIIPEHAATNKCRAIRNVVREIFPDLKPLEDWNDLTSMF